MTYMM